jgi:myosin heavy subunit
LLFFFLIVASVWLSQKEEIVCEVKDVELCEAGDAEKTENLMDLLHLNTPNVVHVLKQRFERQQIYTFSGKVLLSINPYHPLPIYSSSFISQYSTQSTVHLP